MFRIAFGLDVYAYCDNGETMQILQKTKAVAFACAIAALIGGAASAATISSGGSSTQGAGNTAGIDFAEGYGAFVPAGAVATDLPVQTGNAAGQFQSPFNSNALTDTDSFFAAPKDAPGSFTFGSERISFTLLWGSIDSYNILSFDNGFSITGTELIAELGLGGTPDNFEEVALVTFDFENPFTTVTFLSDGRNAFEFAMAPVPVPAAGLMLLTALGGVGLARRRKKVS